MTFLDFIVSVARYAIVLVAVGALGLSGCAVVGPQSISAGRGSYTDVINRTEDEQILNVLVRMRYDETFGMMTVAGVTAKLKFSAEVGANIAVGSSDSYSGNLVPFSAGVAYEESPTISYVPLSGEDFTRRMLSPVSSKEWILLGGPARHPGQVFSLAARRVNGLRNPLLGDEPPSADFERFVGLYDRLRLAGVLDLVQAPEAGNGERYFWDIREYEDAHGESVREFLDLLGVQAKLDGAGIVLPLREGVGRSISAVHLQTRSAYDVLRVFGAGIEIPPVHLEAGIVEPITWAVPEKRRFITIRSSEERPDAATVQVRFRDHWFYIDATDTRSKRAFAFLRTFIGMHLADPGASQQSPILTLPVD